MTIEDRTIAEITLRWPESTAVLEAHGLDTCCGGAHTLKDAVGKHGLVLAQVLEDLEVAGVAEADAPAEAVVDVRDMPPRERHPRIFATFDGLPVGGVLTLVNDHDPKPLFYQMQAERPGQIAWDPQEEGPERWVIRIERVA